MTVASILPDAVRELMDGPTLDVVSRLRDLGLLQRTRALLLVFQNGTITGEHGVGLLRSAWLVTEIGAVGLRVHRAIKDALDSDHLLNPGKVLSAPPSSAARHHVWSVATEAEVADPRAHQARIFESVNSNP